MSKQITTLAKLNQEHAKGGAGGVQITGYGLTLNENGKSVGTVSFYVRMDKHGNISADHNFNFEGNRVVASD